MKPNGQLLQHVVHVKAPEHEGQKKRTDYAFRHEFNDKPSMIQGCPG
jgi:hypothetical protein